MDEQQDDLARFVDPDPPHVQKRSSVELGPRTVGYFGWETGRGRRCYVSEREKGKHRYYGRDKRYDLSFSGEGHGLSLELFPRIDGYDAGIVYIVETDTGDVFEYAFSQYVDGDAVNVGDDGQAAHPDRGYAKDPQKVVPVEDAVEVYRDHASAFRVPVWE